MKSRAIHPKNPGVSFKKNTLRSLGFSLDTDDGHATSEDDESYVFKKDCETWKPEPNWLEYFRMETWYLHDGVSLITNWWPFDDSDIHSIDKDCLIMDTNNSPCPYLKKCGRNYENIYNHALDSIATSSLKTYSKDGPPHVVRPLEFINWAISKHFSIPNQLLRLYGIKTSDLSHPFDNASKASLNSKKAPTSSANNDLNSAHIVEIKEGYFLGKTIEQLTEALKKDAYGPDIVAFILINKKGCKKVQAGRILRRFFPDEIPGGDEVTEGRYRATANKYLQQADKLKIIFIP